MKSSSKLALKTSNRLTTKGYIVHSDNDCKCLCHTQRIIEQPCQCLLDACAELGLDAKQYLSLMAMGMGRNEYRSRVNLETKCPKCDRFLQKWRGRIKPGRTYLINCDCGFQVWFKIDKDAVSMVEPAMDRNE